MEEDEYRPLRKGRADRDRSGEDPYLRDENGRPVDLLRRAPAPRPRRRTFQETGLRTYLILGSVFSGLLAVSGQLLPAGIVALSTLVLALVARWRR